MIARFLAAVVLLAAFALAQSVPSIAPSSAFSTTPNNMPATFNPTTTFSQAVSPVPTTLTGVGPALTTGAATFSYLIPTESIEGYKPTSVYASLASAGLPTNASGPIVAPADPDRQIISPNAASSDMRSHAVVVGAAAALAGGAALFL
ncbi:hypothetical protein K437DRAFT_259305 [Tilletiaria anomala UBC 951]|uniref:Uncharacterized protein n=1 Tax=Tilletiaria anomala (strain ATCC 24038 / CBS 436.72 / UBC 951) TaxID=1037660 RepID=A0A066VIZ5_TILAU|nr:uncharacterized protein K437DRAFT_259305 [Tilletiaria anomala UBC 951]KDN38699.1 hypothetical protein K437DRAFT_259305 [Tilletiaria anomala UBC 951]